MNGRNGIGIREFQKLVSSKISSPSTFALFQRACRKFNSCIKNDNEAKSFAKLYNLNPYKSRPPNEFIRQVTFALEFIENRKRNRALRKGKKIAGVELVYDDENCFIVSPKDYRYSSKAAYLDNGTAPWCIASPPLAAKNTWFNYYLKKAFYIYSKKGNSWAALVNELDVFRSKNGYPWMNGFPFSIIEDRKNQCRENVEKMRKVYENMLSETGLTHESLTKIIEGSIKKKKTNYSDLAVLSSYKKDYDVFRDVGKKSKVLEKPFEKVIDIIGNCITSNNLEMVKFLYEETKIVYDKEGNLLNTLHYASKRENREVFEYLLNKGMDINGRREGELPVIFSAISWKNFNLDDLRYLESKGADIHRKGILETNLAIRCFGDNTLEVLKYLESKGVHLKDNPENILCNYVSDLATCRYEEESVESLKYILDELKIDPNLKSEGRPILWHLAAGTSRFCELENCGKDITEERREQLKKWAISIIRCAKVLIERGADVNWTDEKNGGSGTSPLTIALANHAVPLARLLISKGAKIPKTVPNYRGQSKLNSKFKKFLKKHGITLEAAGMMYQRLSL